MKTKKISYYILMFLPFIITFILLPSLPDKIPAHYGFDGVVNRYGSKYELLLFPLFTIITGCFMLIMAQRSGKKENGAKDEKILLYAGMIVEIVFNVMTYYFLYTSATMAKDILSLSFSVNQVMFTVLGFATIILGFIMPKLPKNSYAGLRTSWSLKNEVTWKKCQEFGGKTFIISGIAMVVATLFTDAITCIISIVAILFITTIVDVIYSYVIAKKY